VPMDPAERTEPPQVDTYKISKYRQPESNRHECYHSTDFKSVASTNSAMAAYLEVIKIEPRLTPDGLHTRNAF
jgi:hypothetical protein